MLIDLINRTLIQGVGAGLRKVVHRQTPFEQLLLDTTKNLYCGLSFWMGFIMAIIFN